MLKPGGRLVFSFLEFAEPGHWPHFQQSVDGLRRSKPGQLNAFIERNVLEAWAARVGFSALAFEDEDGASDHSARLGQSVAVLTR